MQQRESHKKSRKGCQSCKRRHVKCDEQGPPCANCVVRKNECVYLSGSELEKRKTGLTRRPKRIKPAPSSSQEESSRASSTNPNLEVPTFLSRVFTLSPSPVAFSNSVQEERILELELLHRWSTRTFLGICSVPEDGYYLQTYLPQAGLRTNYLLNGILAMAAIDLALSDNSGSSTTRAKYFRTALQYCNKATVDFRIEVQDINQDNLHLLYYFAMLAAVFNFATTFGDLNTLERMDTAYEMLLGSTNIANVNIFWLLDSPTSIRNVINDVQKELLKGGDPFDLIDPETMKALEWPSSLLKEIIEPTTETGELNELGRETISGMGEERFYQAVIVHMKHCFAEDARDKIKFYCFSLISVAGPRYLQAVRRREPMALFIEMYFGILLDRASRDPVAWWVDRTGKEVVREISGLLMDSVVSRVPEGQEGILWARQQVGLPDLLLGS